LINYVIISTENVYKQAKIDARDHLRTFTSIKAQAACGLRPLLPVRVTQVKGKFRHDATIACKNRNSCPWCSTRAMAEHRTKIRANAIHAIDIGGLCLSAVLTLPNRHGHDLEYAYSQLTEQVARFRRLIKQHESGFGITGSVRVFEETYGEINGWHPHANWIWFTSRTLDNAEKEAFTRLVRDFWLKASANGGIRGTSASAQWVGFSSDDASVKATALYVSKHSFYSKPHPVPQPNGNYVGLEP